MLKYRVFLRMKKLKDGSTARARHYELIRTWRNQNRTRIRLARYGAPNIRVSFRDWARWFFWRITLPIRNWVS